MADDNNEDICSICGEDFRSEKHNLVRELRDHTFCSIAAACRIAEADFDRRVWDAHVTLRRDKERIRRHQ